MRPDSSDPLIDEVRGVRREICAEFGNDVVRLADDLKRVEAAYAARAGVFGCVNPEAAAQVVCDWGEEPHRVDDSIVDEVRQIRRELSDRS